MRNLACVAVIGLAAGCNGGGNVTKIVETGSSSFDFSDLEVELLVSCDDPSSELDGTTPEGSECTEIAECAPVCCPCYDGGGNQVSTAKASNCEHGICAGETETCAPAPNSLNPAFCL